MDSGSSPDIWDGIVGELYDAVLQKEASALDAAIRRFEHIIDSDGCHLFGMTQRGQEVFTLCTYPDGVSTETAPYYQHYINLDPRLALTKERVGKAERSSDHFRPDFVKRNEFFQDYLIPLGRQHMVGGMLLKTETFNSTVAFNRFQGRPDFSDDELSIVRRYFPHLMRAVGMSMNETVSTLLHGSLADVLQQQTAGVIGFNHQNRVLFINAAAQQLLVPLADLGLQGTTFRDGSAIALACKQAHRSRQPQALRHRAAEGELIITAWAAPKRRSRVWLPSVSAASDHSLHTCILVQWMRPGHRLTPGLLMQLYGFTATEARLAKELVQGTSVEAYAQTYHVSVATVRTQLRQVLAKSGHSRQQELIAHLASLQML
jgi:DNA-binding CsgD family transcriptional regulator